MKKLKILWRSRKSWSYAFFYWKGTPEPTWMPYNSLIYRNQMKFYYVEWGDFSFHEIEGEYSSKKSPYTTGYMKNLKYAKLEGIETPVVIDYIFQPYERNYTTNLEKLKEKVFEFVSSYIIYHQNHIEYYEKELYDCKKSLETLKEKSKHLFKDT